MVVVVPVVFDLLFVYRTNFIEFYFDIFQGLAEHGSNTCLTFGSFPAFALDDWNFKGHCLFQSCN